MANEPKAAPKAQPALAGRGAAWAKAVGSGFLLMIALVTFIDAGNLRSGARARVLPTSQLVYDLLGSRMVMALALVLMIGGLSLGVGAIKVLKAPDR